MKSLVYIVVALAVAAGMFFWLRPQSSASGANGDSAEATLPLETFVVNLEGTGQRAYLRVGIALGMSHPLPRNHKDDVPVALVRDAILSVLSSTKPEQLLTADGKEQLKADLLKAIAARAPQLGVEHVYFTEFLVQM